ncbi:MAG TPA: hypothetical protein VMG12_10290 [Polyangiaceae bacterium]|nr:hypothetical protein [Polyangiaceae bacterium]
MRAIRLGLWLALAQALLGGCGGCGHDTPLARLTASSGQVERDTAHELGHWRPAADGDSFQLGDGVRTLVDSSARLELDDGSALGLEALTSIRFSEHPPSEQTLAFDVETGEAVLQAGAEAVNVQTRVGLARIDSRSTVRLGPAEGGVRFVVHVGHAVFGGSNDLRPGDEVVVSSEGVAQPAAPRVAVAPAPSTSAPNAPPSAPAPLFARVKGRGARLANGAGWSLLAEGSAPLAPGSKLRLSRDTEVEVTRDAERATLDQPGDYVIAPNPTVLVAAARGGLTAGGASAVRIEVPGGVIVVAAEGRARVQTGERGTRVDVLGKSAQLESAERSETLLAGQRGTLRRGAAPDIEGRSLDYADLEIAAGDSVIVHDPKPPTAVRFAFGDACAGHGRIDLTGPSEKRTYAAGAAAVTLGLDAGTFRYQLSCDGATRVSRKGRVRVLRDAGTRRVVAKPPTTRVVADGRPYTVLYQNRLPRIELSWKNPPSAPNLQLLHERADKTSETIALSQPAYAFEPGKLGEGEHVFAFQGGGRLSRRTPVLIAFDNAAPTATLDVPIELDGGAPVEIRGAALPGWDVRVEQQKPSLDAQGRFSLTSPWPSDRRAIAVWLSHAGRETHVYLRRGRTP